ncbi:MAG: hypothetical protein MK101_01385, partial [Phycisphaerales bacterium]|nr:hypothetical protein [Phycisphaerales bacterium]
MSNWLTRLIIVTVALLMTPATMAQGANRHFAEPMSWATLRERLANLSPAPGQWADLEAAHSQYLAEMDELRAGAIARWLASPGSQMGAEFSDPEASAQSAREQSDLRNKLAQIDETFFDQAATVMGEAQQQPLERMRLRRARDRMLGKKGRGAGFRFELRDHIDPMVLTDDTRSLLFDWEDRRTDLLRTLIRLDEEQSRAMREVMSEFQAALVDQVTGNPDDDADLATQMQHMVKERLAESRAPYLKALKQCRAHNWAGTRTLSDELPSTDAHRLRMAYLDALDLHINHDLSETIRNTGLGAQHPDVLSIVEAFHADMGALMPGAV